MIEKLKGNIYIVLIYRLLIAYLLYTISRLLFFCLNLDSFPAVSVSRFFMFLAGGLKFDTSAIFYTNSLFVLSQVLPFRFRYGKTYQKVSFWIFYVINALALALNMGDIAYYPFTLKRTTFTVFSQFSNEENLGSLFIKFIFVDYWYLCLLFVGMIAGMVWMYRRVEVKRPYFSNKLMYYGSSPIAMLLVVWVVIAGMRGGFKHSTRPITISNAGEFVENVSEINIVINTPFSIIRTLKAKPLPRVQYFADEDLDSIYSPVKFPQPKGAFKNKNVVVLILESYSREYLGGFNKSLENGKYRGYTPFLDSLKKVSLSFNNAYANGRKSIEGLPSVTSSIPGINEPFILSYYSANKISSLGGLLKAKGYHTSFFHGAPNGSMGFSSYVKMAGIEHYYGMNEYKNDKDFDGMWGIWDEPFLQYMAKNLDSFKQPFYSNVFTLSSHHPFKLPAQYEGKFPKGTLPVHQNVGYTDMALRKFFQTASKSPWYKNTLFVITADHSSLAWHDEYKTSMGAFAVPIIFFDPSGELKGEVNEPVQHIDIMPTVLNYLNYDKPYFAFGNDVLHRAKNDFVINTIDNKYQIVKGDYIMQWGDDKVTGLYNYRQDILMQKDLSASELAVKNELETYVKAFIQQYNKNMIDNSLVVADEKREHRLSVKK